MAARSVHARSRVLACLVAALAGAVAIACSSTPDAPTDAGGSTCVAVAPGCPDAGAPSYKADIAPILQQACIPCHSAGGTAGYDESTYAEVYAQFGAMDSQVAICAMPPSNGPPLSDAQRIALTAWLKCGAPNN